MTNPWTIARSPRQRKGFMMMAAVLCLAAALATFAGLFASLLEQGEYAARERRRIQAAWLADSALERGAARLRADASYTGETWRIDAKELGGLDPGAATIRLESIDGAPQRRRLRVTADYPADSEQRARVSREFVVELHPAN